MPRVRRVGEGELGVVLAMMDSHPVRSGGDDRSLRHIAKPCGSLSAARVYKLLRFGGLVAPFAASVWATKAPSRVKFFFWLLMQKRIHTRDVLLKKHIVVPEGAGCPVCEREMESADHLILSCPFAESFWRRIGVTVGGAGEDCLAHLASAVRSAVGSAPEFTMLCCWHLWKHRKAVVFQAQRPSVTRLLGSCREDAMLWRGRLKEACRVHVDDWMQALG